MGRAFGSLIYHAVEKMMMDPEVLARMKTRGDAKCRQPFYGERSL
jgi:hypothetical protein